DKIAIDGPRPSPEAAKRLKALDPQTLAQQLGIAQKESAYDAESLGIKHQRMMIYQYQEAKRTLAMRAILDDDSADSVDPFAIPLPPVPTGIAEGRYYVVAAVYFDLKPKKRRDSIHWVALVEANTLAVLYLEAFVSGINGKVFLVDPLTTYGSPLPSG